VERDLLKRAKDGDDFACGELIKWHLDVVIRRAWLFNRRWNFLERDDLIQYGCVGILKAIDRFDLNMCTGERPVRFVTYAVYWIDHFILRSIQRYNRTVRTPASVQRDIRRLLNARDEALVNGRGDVDLETLAKELGMSQRQWESTCLAPREMVFLDSLTEDRGELLERPHFVDFLQDDTEHQRRQKEARIHLQCVISCLPQREQLMLENLFGLNGTEPKSTGEVGQILGVSRCRIGQLRQRALKRMRDFATVNET
jgi:RNA polymerase primary sigma factor